MSTPWKKLKSNTIKKTKWIEIVEDEVIVPSGDKSTYTYIVRNDGVAIILIDNDYTYLVSQYRYPVQKTLYQFPLEGAEKGENLESAARRGLEEEIGWISRDFTKIGQGYIDAGLNTQLMHYFVTTNFEKGKEQKLEDSEKDLKIHKVKISDLDNYIKEGKIIDSHTIMGIYFLQKYFMKHSALK